MPESIEDLEAPLRRHAERAAEKIRACVAEDQRVAQNAPGMNWQHEDVSFPEAPEVQVWDENGTGRAIDVAEASGVFAGAHIVRHDPAHVLAWSATLLDVLADLEKIAERSPHPDPRAWARLAICELARAWDLDEDEAPQQP